MLRPYRIKITIVGTLTSYHVSGNTLDEAHNEAVRWINNHPALRAKFEVIANG